MNSYFAKLTFNSYFYLHSLSFLIFPLFLTYFLQLNSNSSGACMCMQFTFSPLLFKKGKGGRVAVVVGFLLICVFEP